MTHRAFTEARELLASGELVDAADRLREGIAAHVRASGDTFDADVMAARFQLAEILALAGLRWAHEALDVLAAVARDLDRYRGADRAHAIARSAELRAEVLLHLGQHAGAGAEAIRSLRVLAGALQDLDPDGAGLPQIGPDEAAALLMQAASAAKAGRGPAVDFAGGLAMELARACATVATAHCAADEFLAALPWLDAVYRAGETVPEPFATNVLGEACRGYGVIAMADPSAGGDLVAERFERLSDRLANALHDIPGAESFSMRFERAAQRVHLPDGFGEDDVRADLDVLLSEADGARDPGRRCAVLLERALHDLRNDRLDDVEAAAREASALLERFAGDSVHQVRAWGLLAAVALRRKAFEELRRWASASVAELMRLHARGMIVGTRGATLAPAAVDLFLLATAYRELGNDPAAIFFGKLALTGAHEVQQEMAASLPQALLDAGAIPPELRQLGDDMIRWLQNAGRLGEALLLAGLDDAIAPTPRAEFGAKALPLTPVERRLAARFAAFFARRDLARDAFVHAFDELVATTAAKVAAGAAGAPAAVTAREQIEVVERVTHWDDATAFVRYLPSPDRLRIVVATPRGARSVESATTEHELGALVLAYLRALASPARVDLSLPQTLYEALVAPIAGVLGEAGTTRLLISARGVLRFLPFAALHDGSRYLVERLACVTYFASAAGSLERIPTARPQLALLGRTRESGAHAMPALRSVTSEFDAIAAACRSGGHAIPEPVVVLDECFTAAALRSALHGNADAVHVATHFIVDPADPRASRLLLGDDVLLPVEEFAALGLRASGLDLVVLSACSTAVPGPDDAACPYVSAAAVLHEMGARSALTTLWRLYSAAGAELMEVFYRGLFAAAPLDKAEALRQAQLALLRGTRSAAHAPESFAHPHYWAPFVLSGNWRAFAQE